MSGIYIYIYMYHQAGNLLEMRCIICISRIIEKSDPKFQFSALESASSPSGISTLMSHACLLLRYSSHLVDDTCELHKEKKNGA